jgi:hypothetical protein
VLAHKRLRAARRRVERDAAHGWAETILWQIEVFERAPHEDARCVNRVAQRIFSVREQHAHTSLRKQTRRLKPREPRTNDYNIETFHTFSFTPPLKKDESVAV